MSIFVIYDKILLLGVMDMNERIIEIIKDEVMKRCYSPNNTCGVGAWTHHINIVYILATKMASNYKADLEIVRLAALLHDIASVTDESYLDNHHIIGAKIAEELLRELNYPAEKIKRIQNCILNHRGSVLKEKHTPEEICISDADAMTHFYNLPSLFSLVYKERNLDIDEGTLFIKNKLERSYNKLSDMGKKIVKDQYNAAMKILDVSQIAINDRTK